MLSTQRRWEIGEILEGHNFAMTEIVQGQFGENQEGDKIHINHSTFKIHQEHCLALAKELHDIEPEELIEFFQ